MSDGADAELRTREAAFHDAWAAETAPESVPVLAAFESPVALENRWVLARAGPLAGRRLLDVGTGLGEAAVYFALQGARVTATDLSPGMVAAAARLAAHHGVTIDTAVGPAEALPFPDASFDLVYAANVLHHVQERERFLAELRRVLVPGGRFFTIDPLAYNPVIAVYRRIATAVRTPDEAPLTLADLRRARARFEGVEHHETWIAALALFLKYYLVDRVHPNADRYWKRILRERDADLRWWRPLAALDALLTRLPLVRWLAWNVVMTGVRPRSAER